MTAAYHTPGIRLARGVAADPEVIRALQLDLRRLGYLRAGLDGAFGSDTERAVRALQLDLLDNDGRGDDGAAPVAITSFNEGRVRAVTGVVDEGLAACLEALAGDARVPQLPRSDDARADNDRVRATLRALETPRVPVPFLLAILAQESGLMHFRVPGPGNPDAFIVVGLDRNDPAAPERVTSRGYGVGQFTLFHHPPRPEEVAGVMLDPVGNVQRAIGELREKFDRFVNGARPGARADDRIAAVGRAPLRACRYDPADPRYQRDCRRCALEAPALTLTSGTPLFPGSPDRLAPTTYHPETRYTGVPDWKTLGCDWPYAVRRYNGSGVNSYHYQIQVVSRLTHDPEPRG